MGRLSRSRIRVGDHDGTIVNHRQKQTFAGNRERYEVVVSSSFMRLANCLTPVAPGGKESDSGRGGGGRAHTRQFRSITESVIISTPIPLCPLSLPTDTGAASPSFSPQTARSHILKEGFETSTID